MSEDNSIYTRQKTLGINVPPKIVVIGVGGIGYWVGLQFALLGTQHILAVDGDSLDSSNLNRLPYTPNMVDVPKVALLAGQIKAMRPDAAVYPVIGHDDSIPQHLLEQMDGALVLDARDNLQPLDTRLHTIASDIIALSYDGLSVSIWRNPKYEEVVAAGTGYETIPSYVGTPLLIAALVVNAVATNTLPPDGEIIAFEVKDMLKTTWTQYRLSAQSDELLQIAAQMPQQQAS